LSTPATVTAGTAATWRRTLAAVIAGRAEVEELIFRSDFPGSEKLIADELRVGLERQDWDAVEALLPVCAAAPDRGYVAPLIAILDRECLEISNLTLLKALAVIGDPGALPAIRRAYERTCVPGPDWAPGHASSVPEDPVRDFCAAILQNQTEREP
jgi:hypothetical protein